MQESNWAFDRSFGGYIVFLELPRIQEILESTSSVEFFLGAEEFAFWNRCVTKKRRVEFLGGRLSVKVAANLLRSSLGVSPSSWTCMNVGFRPGKGFVCRHCDDFEHPVSISHSKGLAAAIAFKGVSSTSLDIENATFHGRNMSALFNDRELIQTNFVSTASERWTVKEAYCKLMEIPIFGRQKDITTYFSAKEPGIERETTLISPSRASFASGSRGVLSLTIGWRT